MPPLSVTDERDKLPAAGSQYRWVEEALARVLDVLPPGVRPGVVGDRDFGRAGRIEWLQARGVDYVLRLKRGALITEANGTRWQLGAAGLRPGQTHGVPGVRYGTDHDRPRDLVVHLACSWRSPKRRRAKKGQEDQEPWDLATSLGNLGAAVAWYRQRMWLEETFRGFQSGFGLHVAQVASARRLGRLVAAFSLALAWLHVLAAPQARLLPRGWAASVVTHGHASRVSLALALLDYLLVCSPGALPWSAPAPDPSSKQPDTGYGSGVHPT